MPNGRPMRRALRAAPRPIVSGHAARGPLRSTMETFAFGRPARALARSHRSSNVGTVDARRGSAVLLPRHTRWSSEWLHALMTSRSTARPRIAAAISRSGSPGSTSALVSSLAATTRSFAYATLATPRRPGSPAITMSQERPWKRGLVATTSRPRRVRAPPSSSAIMTRCGGAKGSETARMDRCCARTAHSRKQCGR